MGRLEAPTYAIEALKKFFGREAVSADDPCAASPFPGFRPMAEAGTNG